MIKLQVSSAQGYMPKDVADLECVDRVCLHPNVLTQSLDKVIVITGRRCRPLAFQKALAITQSQEHCGYLHDKRN